MTKRIWNPPRPAGAAGDEFVPHGSGQEGQIINQTPIRAPDNLVCSDLSAIKVPAAEGRAGALCPSPEDGGAQEKVSQLSWAMLVLLRRLPRRKRGSPKALDQCAYLACAIYSSPPSETGHPAVGRRFKMLSMTLRDPTRAYRGERALLKSMISADGVRARATGAGLRVVALSSSAHISRIRRKISSMDRS